jgi:hypothetical protein
MNEPETQSNQGGANLHRGAYRRDEGEMDGIPEPVDVTWRHVREWIVCIIVAWFAIWGAGWWIAEIWKVVF